MKLSEKIEYILDSDITGYKIKKISGVNEGTISRLRNKESKIGNLTLINAEKLEKVYDECIKKKEETYEKRNNPTRLRK